MLTKGFNDNMAGMTNASLRNDSGPSYPSFNAFEHL